MADGKVLEFRGVTKLFGDVAAVSDFTARVEPGAVTGFVGPNGAGKSTTLRILLGDIKPTEGVALIGGVPYARLPQPRRTVGALLENVQYRPRRTAERHLLGAARAVGVPAARVAEVLDIVGLGGVGDMRIGGFSLGMRQRLGVAEALLGDPEVLIFDEPANGLDPEGIRWMRLLMRRLADEGRTVLMSSHVLSEVQQVADNILIISNGRLLFSGGIEQLADVDAVVAVDSPNRAALRDALRARGLEFELLRSGINVAGATTAQIGELAAEAGVPLSSLQLRQHTLEDVFLKVVNGSWTGPASGAAAAKDEAPADDAPAGEAPADEAPAGEAAPADGEAPIAEVPGAGDAPQADADPADAAPDGAGADDAGRTDDAGAPVEAVDELPFAPATSDSEVAVDEQPLADAPQTPAPAAEADPLAFLQRPLSEIERDVVAGETRLIAASPEGEQPTPGWLPAPEYVPSPAEEDADDPDALETPDSVIDLPGEQSRDEESREEAQALPEVEASVDELKPRPASDGEHGDAAEPGTDTSQLRFDSFLAAFEHAETQDAIESVAATEADAPAAEPQDHRPDEGRRED